MPTGQHQFVRTDISELKSQIEKKIGRVKTESYLNLLSKFLSFKISKSDFDKLIIATVKKENISLHNALLRGILKNASLSKTPPLIKNGVLGVNSLCKDLPKSPRKGRTQVRRFKDCDNNGSKGKSQIIEAVVVSSSCRQQQWSMDDGEEEEVDQLIQSWKSQPIEAPFGVNLGGVIKKQVHIGTCYSSGELPDSVSLKKKLEDDLGLKEEGLEVSVGVANLLNAGLNVFLKRLIKPCLELAASRSSSRGRAVSSLVDFQVAMESNPSLLGEKWPAKLEKIRLGTLDLPAGFQRS